MVCDINDIVVTGKTLCLGRWISIIIPGILLNRYNGGIGFCSIQLFTVSNICQDTEG